MKARTRHIKRMVGLLVTGGGFAILLSQAIEQVLRS